MTYYLMRIEKEHLYAWALKNENGNAYFLSFLMSLSAPQQKVMILSLPHILGDLYIHY